jgi:Chromo (CHRromatin Organisation MOdifier) domain
MVDIYDVGYGSKRRTTNLSRSLRNAIHDSLAPFQILECVGESKLAYKLDLPATMRIHPVFLGSLLTPYHASAIPGHTQPPPPPIEVEGQQEYEVEEILDSKIVRNKLRYLVSWIGYTPNNRTWEPAEHLENSPEIVAPTTLVIHSVLRPQISLGLWLVEFTSLASTQYIPYDDGTEYG